MPLVLAASLAGQDQPAIRVSGVPASLALPLPEGRSLVLTADVGGPGWNRVWLATSADARARVMLTQSGLTTWQVDLADPVVARVLLADDRAESFQVFADSPLAGALLSSPPFRFHHAAVPRSELHVRTGAATLCVPPRTTWFSPAQVLALSLPLEPGRLPDAFASAGEHRWKLEPTSDRRELVLEITPAIRQAWQGAEFLTVRTGERASFRLRATPRSLDLTGNVVPFTVVQRRSVVIPGSRDWLHLSIGDVTGGQVLVTVETAEGSPLVTQRSVKQGEHLALVVGEARYTLTLDKLTNVLIGDDWAAFALSELQPDERRRIERLIDHMAAAKVGFLREGVEHDGATAAAHIRQKYESAGPKVKTLDEFIDKIASRSWTTGNPYEVKLADGSKVDAAVWLRQQAKELEAPAEAGR